MRNVTTTGAVAAMWGEAIASVRRAAERLEATDGREVIEDLELRFQLKMLDAQRFPVEAASARACAAAFLGVARALFHQDTTMPPLRARLAGGALGLAVALDGLLADRLADETQVWRDRIGEGA